MLILLHADPEYFKHRMTTFAGFPYDFADKNTHDDSPEEREKFFEKLWSNGETIFSHPFISQTF